MQDEIGQKIVLALKVKLTPQEQERFKRFPTDNLEAYDYVLRGAEYQYRFTKEANAQARQMFERAIALDPHYAGAYAWLGWTYRNDGFFQWSQDPQQDLERAFALAQRARALDDSLPDVHQLLSVLYLWQKQPELAIAEGEQGIALDPNYADGYAILAEVLSFAGRPEEAIGVAKKAIRLNPRGPAFYWAELGFAYYLMKRYEEALLLLKEALARSPDLLPAHVVLAATYAELGREEEALAEAHAVLGINPILSLDGLRQRLPYKDPAALERYLAALRKAGLK